MKMVTIRMEDFLYDFYEKVGRQANLPPEQVMADALFKLAGELSLHALHDAKFPRRGRCGHRPLQGASREGTFPVLLLHSKNVPLIRGGRLIFLENHGQRLRVS